jgi:hypothetical protein
MSKNGRAGFVGRSAFAAEEAGDETVAVDGSMEWEGLETVHTNGEGMRARLRLIGRRPLR